MTDRCYYVYIHRRATDGTIFYVGKGKGQRGSTTFGRNLHWQRIVAKHGYEVEYVFTNLTSDCAFSIEMALIASIGMKNLANLTGGGEGMSQASEELRKRLSDAAKARGLNENCRIAGLTARTGKKNSQKQIEATRKAKSIPIISSDGRIFPSASEAARQIAKETGKYASQGNISMCANGNRDNAYELTWSYDLTKIPEFRETDFRQKKIIALETGQVFGSTQLATAWVREWRGVANNQCITQAARTNRKAYGYSWRYTEDVA